MPSDQYFSSSSSGRGKKELALKPFTESFGVPQKKKKKKKERIISSDQYSSSSSRRGRKEGARFGIWRRQTLCCLPAVFVFSFCFVFVFRCFAIVVLAVVFFLIAITSTTFFPSMVPCLLCRHSIVTNSFAAKTLLQIHYMRESLAANRNLLHA